jgi:hypothetical protein
MESNTKDLTTTELSLQVGNPLLIVLTPYSAKNAWWRDRVGILTLHTKGTIEWSSDHQKRSQWDSKGGEVFHEYIKQAIRDDWDVYLASSTKTDRIWYEPTLSKWQQEEDRVIIPVNRSRR